MKLVVVNRFFHPDVAPTGQYAADVAFDLAAAGHEVHVVTSRLSYGGGEAYAAEETIRGVRIHRVRTSRFGRSSLLGRAVDYLTFYLFATAYLARSLRPGDVVVAMTDPPLLSVFVAFAARLRNARLVNWTQDLFPEVASVLGMRALSGPLGAVLRAARDWSLQVAVANVALGDRMASFMRGRLGKYQGEVAVIHNWADGARIAPRSRESGQLPEAWGLQDRFIVGYSGNMGRAHDIETIVAACVKMKDDPGVAFVFTGGGQKRALVARAIAASGLDNVRLLPYVANELLAESLAACDAHLVSLLPGAEGMIVPSKFYGIAAAARSAIFVGDGEGEIARLIRQHDCGACVPAGDVEGLVAAIRDLQANPARCRSLGARARLAFEREWDKPIALARWRGLLTRAGGFDEKAR